jgi:phosphoserine phosphatase
LRRGQGECLPQNKVEFVRAMKAKGYKVAVVGDGVNDAPALAAATSASRWARRQRSGDSQRDDCADEQ